MKKFKEFYKAAATARGAADLWTFVINGGIDELTVPDRLGNEAERLCSMFITHEWHFQGMFGGDWHFSKGDRYCVIKHYKSKTTLVERE